MQAHAHAYWRLWRPDMWGSLGVGATDSCELPDVSPESHIHELY